MKVSIKKYALSLAHSLKAEKDPNLRKKHIENLLQMIRKRKQLKLLKRFLPVFKAVWQEVGGETEIDVTVPFEMIEQEKTSLEKFFGETFKSDVRVNVNVDKEVIGGMRLEFGEYIIDGTIKKNLEILKSKIAYNNN